MSNTGMPELLKAPPAAAAATVPASAGGRSYGGQSLQDRVASRRERFIAAGIEVFGTQGLRGATVRGVCTAAGLTDRYFYESFDSLEALLQAAYLKLMDRLRHRLLQVDATAHGSLAQRATAGYEAWFDEVADPRFARIVLAEVLGVSPAVDALYDAGMRDFAELTTAPMAAALPPGRLPPEQRALIGRALVGAAIQVAKMWVTGGYREPRAAVVHSCVLVAVGTLRALADEPPAA